MNRMSGETALGLAWIIALVASLAVLFIGEVLGHTPYALCWFQRAFMFPLAIVLGLALWWPDGRVGRYGIALAHNTLACLQQGRCICRQWRRALARRAMDQRAAFDQVVKPELLNRIGLRNRLLSRMTLGFAAGALTVLTFPPLSILLLVPVAYSALFVGLRDLSFGRASLVGCAFGFGQFGFGISWIAESFYVEAERFGALAIPAVV